MSIEEADTAGATKYLACCWCGLPASLATAVCPESPDHDHHVVPSDPRIPADRIESAVADLRTQQLTYKPAPSEGCDHSDTMPDGMGGIVCNDCGRAWGW